MKRVFLNFRSEDRPQVNGPQLLAANPKFDVEFHDESVRAPIDSADRAYVRRQIREKINRTSFTAGRFLRFRLPRHRQPGAPGTLQRLRLLGPSSRVRFGC